MSIECCGDFLYNFLFLICEQGHWALKPVLGVYGCHEERNLFHGIPDRRPRAYWYMMDLDLGTSVILMIQAGVVPSGCETAKCRWNIWPWENSEHDEWLQDLGSEYRVQDRHPGI